MLNQLNLKKLESQSFQIKLSIKQETKRLERLNSQLSLTQHQLNVYSQELENIKVKIQFFNEKFTKELCSELRSIRAPVSVLLDLSTKFLKIIGIKDQSWQSFRSLTKDYPTIKSLMVATQDTQIPEHTINEVLQIWKNQMNTKAKLLKITPGASILFDWLMNIIEYNIKKEIILNSQKRLPELEKKIKGQTKVLLELSKEELSIEELQIMNGIESERDEGESSITSKPYSFLNEETGGRGGFQSTDDRRSANGGIFAIEAQEKDFPDFAADNLYGEVPVDKGDKVDIVIETGSERIGCCRMKFFCF